MKKLLVLLLALLVSSAMLAQGSRKSVNRNSFLAFQAGPSFPLGDFKSSDAKNENAGFAKTGYNIGLNYTYLLNAQAGLTAGVFYNRYPTKDVEFEIDMGDGTRTITMKMDNWQFYGITAGPALNFEVAKNINTGIRVMGGIANARTPEIKYDNSVMLYSDWGIGAVLQGGIDLRLGLGSNVYVVLNADYLYMNPQFQPTDFNDEQTEKVHQKISVLNTTAGIGIRF